MMKNKVPHQNYKLNLNFMKPAALWAFGKNDGFPRDFAAGTSTHTPNNLTITNAGVSRGFGKFGVSVVGNITSGVASGFKSSIDTSGLEGATSATVFAVVEFQSLASTAECGIIRAEGESGYSFAIDVFPSTGKIRPLINTSGGTTGWTANNDVTVSLATNTPYLICIRYITGSPIQTSVTPIGCSVKNWLSTTTVVSGSIVSSAAPVSLGGMYRRSGSAFPGKIYMAGILPYSISNSTASTLAINPWQIFLSNHDTPIASILNVLRRALYWNGTNIANVPTAELGTGKKPLVLMPNGTIKERSASEGIPLIIDVGSIRTINSATESLEI